MDSNALARLKAVAARQTVTLTHYGRKSGKPYDVTIWFVVDGDKVYIGTANVNRQWVRNVQRTPRIRLAVGGETFAVWAESDTVRTDAALGEFAEQLMCAHVPEPNDSIVALPKFSTITSARAMSLRTTSLPDSVFRSMARLFLLALVAANS